MAIKLIFVICFISSAIIAANAGYCYYGGCHADTGGIFEKACPTMADQVGRDNMRIVFDTKCDTWHERLWGRKNFCCTNDCNFQECGKSCDKLGMKAVEENDHTKSIKCTKITNSGEEFDGVRNFCCKK